MPTYAFKCKTCERLVDNKFLPITHTRADTPECCGENMGYHITHPPIIHWKDPNIEAFRPIATKNAPIINTQRENREYMARHDLIDANELGPPPSHEDQARENAELQKSIDAITPNDEQAAMMRDSGQLDIVD